MINQNYFVVFDLETDNSNPLKANPLQIAAIVVHPRSLEVVENSAFSSWCRPDDFDDPNYYHNNQDTIIWHANNFGITPKEFLDKIDKSPSEKEVWNNFLLYLKSWSIPGKSKTVYTAPILCGYNIFEFDLIILKRLANKYGNVGKDGSPNFYQKRDTVDIMKLVFAWSESLTALPNYKMDTLREVFDINHVGIAHEGLKDCYDEATLLIKYLRLHRKLAKEYMGWK